MRISYKRLNGVLYDKRMSLNTLFQEGVISHYAYTQMLKDKPVNIKYLANICKFLNVPIEEVVEVILED